MKAKPTPPLSPTSKQLTGQNAEARAEDYLSKQGLRPIERNFSCKQGEIDLIMRDGATLVFVEVRFRKNALFGSALETVNYRKQRKIIAAGQFYLLTHSAVANSAIRFDVIGITGEDIQWVRSAFNFE